MYDLMTELTHNTTTPSGPARETHSTGAEIVFSLVLGKVR